MDRRRVLVVGAGGKTGEITLRKMASMTDHLDVSGTARTQASATLVEQKTGAPCSVCNLLEPSTIDAAVEGVDTLVILSSATPKPNMFKLFGFFAQKFCCCDKKVQMGSAFEYTPDGVPKKVDWEGVRELIDAAKKAGVQHVILVGSMGGTKPDHFLNKMGNGDILLWKRKAEMYLQSSGLMYTIVHPGGLLPHHGNKLVPGGQRELIVGVDDLLMERKNRCIPREDVANVVVQCVLDPDTVARRSFDIISNEPEEGKSWDYNLKTLLAGLRHQNCAYNCPKHPILQG